MRTIVTISPRQEQTPRRPYQKFSGRVPERRVNHGCADASSARPIQQKEGIPPEIWAGEDQGGSIQRPRGTQFDQSLDLLCERLGAKTYQRKGMLRHQFSHAVSCFSIHRFHFQNIHLWSSPALGPGNMLIPSRGPQSTK